MKPWNPRLRIGRDASFGARDLSLSGAIDRMALERAIDDLPTGYRLIFVLHDIEGYEHNEIASMLDCSIGNSKSQLHKARLKLRDALRSSSPAGGAAMTEDANNLTCAEFQAQLPELIGSGDRIAEHPHLQELRALPRPARRPGDHRRGCPSVFPIVEPPDELWEQIESAIKKRRKALPIRTKRSKPSRTMWPASVPGLDSKVCRLF
jgi:hypothetical protein